MKSLLLALAFCTGCAGDAHVGAVVDDMADAHPVRTEWIAPDMAARVLDLSWPGYPDTCNSGCTPPGGPGSGPGGHSLK